MIIFWPFLVVCITFCSKSKLLSISIYPWLVFLVFFFTFMLVTPVKMIVLSKDLLLLLQLFPFRQSMLTCLVFWSYLLLVSVKVSIKVHFPYFLNWYVFCTKEQHAGLLLWSNTSHLPLFNCKLSGAFAMFTYCVLHRTRSIRYTRYLHWEMRL